MENYNYNFYPTKISKYNIPFKCNNHTLINDHINVASRMSFGNDVSQIFHENILLSYIAFK